MTCCLTSSQVFIEPFPYRQTGRAQRRNHYLNVRITTDAFRWSFLKSTPLVVVYMKRCNIDSDIWQFWYVSKSCLRPIKAGWKDFNLFHRHFFRLSTIICGTFGLHNWIIPKFKQYCVSPVLTACLKQLSYQRRDSIRWDAIQKQILFKFSHMLKYICICIPGVRTDSGIIWFSNMLFKHAYALKLSWTFISLLLYFSQITGE